jgi:diphthamide synthase (EF-2-diphthine--ammonia ligase)
MIQTPGAPAEFTVRSGENVAVTIEAFSCACNTGGAFDNKPLGHVSNDPDVYQFAVVGNSGEDHFFVYVCHFFAADLPAAHYVVSASGDQGGGTFAVRSVAKQTATPAQFQLKFTIA